MKKLFNLAFSNKNNRTLAFLTVVTMCFYTIASYLEILSLGVITKKGQDLLEQQKKSDIIQNVIDFVNYYLPISTNMKYLAAALISVAIFKALTLFAHRFTVRLMSIRVSQELRQKYFEHLQILPMEFFQRHNIGALSQRVVGDAQQIADAVSASLMNYLQTPFTVISTMVLCIITSWQLSLVVFIGFPLILFPIFFISRRVRKISRQIQQNRERFTSVLIDFLAGIQTVKVFAMEDFSLKKYIEQNERIAKLERKSARYDLSSRPVVHLLAMSFLSISLLYGLYVLEMSVSETFFFVGLLYVLYEPIKKFAEENSQIQRGIAAADRMFEVLEMKPQITDHATASSMASFEGPIEFKNVSFKYDNQWVLKNLSFSVRKGETVAIVGPTGAGKSTIVQLLPRLYEVQEGEILINGKSVNTYTQKSLRDNIAFVPQKPFLFLDTVAENISYGRKFTQHQIEAAAKMAHAEEFIVQLPEGYMTELSEGGKNLSGGQQQRLAIARALVKGAPILVLDEATSSLDNVSEHFIQSAIQELRGKITQIIIAHRLTTIEDADRIIYLEKGVKIAEGTKDELLKSCPEFHRMWHSRDEGTKGVHKT
jgi:ABC-type multidrug transport system fused ATPase/permease subunit